MGQPPHRCRVALERVRIAGRVAHREPAGELARGLVEQLESAHDELEFGRAVGNFDRVIVNDDLETAFAELDAAAQASLTDQATVAVDL